MKFIYEVYFVVSNGLDQDKRFPIYKFHRELDKPMDPNELIEIIGSLSGTVMFLTGQRCQISNEQGYRRLCAMSADFASTRIEIIDPEDAGPRRFNEMAGG